jgi:hypothetical protein
MKPKSESTEAKRYHANDANGGLFYLGYESDEELGKWATDPNCIDATTCALILAERRTNRAAANREKTADRARKRAELQDNPFDPRTEVSADAKHVVKHLWILLVLLPFTIGVPWLVLRLVTNR